MDRDKKGILAIIGAKPSGDGEEDMGSEVKRTAAADFSRAVKDGDPDAIVSAFERLRDACESKNDDEDDY